MPFVVIVGATILNLSKRQDAVTAELRDLYTKRVRIKTRVIFFQRRLRYFWKGTAKLVLNDTGTDQEKVCTPQVYCFALCHFH